MPAYTTSVFRLSFLPLLLVGGTVLTAAIYNGQEISALSSDKPPISRIDTASMIEKARISGQPQRIVIPSAGIDLPIVDGIYDATVQDWSVSKTAANYATITPELNNIQGKTLIYGHATQAVFGKIKTLKQGEEVIVHASNDRGYRYKITEERNVVPTDVSVFKELDGNPGLVLITCDGAWSEQRKIIFLQLVEIM